LGEVFVVGSVVFVAAEIDVMGLFEAALAVDCGVDLVVRKNETLMTGIVHPRP
jgi:hypothetical protein